MLLAAAPELDDGNVDPIYPDEAWPSALGPRLRGAASRLSSVGRAEAHAHARVRTELGLRVLEVESLADTAGKLEARASATATRRDAALAAGAMLATVGCRHRLLAIVFSKWVRACCLRPARQAAERLLYEATMLARELRSVERGAAHSAELGAAAELHVLSLREQLALSSTGDGEAAKAAGRLRLRLRESEAERDSLAAQLAAAREEARVRDAAAAEEVADAHAAAAAAEGERAKRLEAERAAAEHKEKMLEALKACRQVTDSGRTRLPTYPTPALLVP